MPPSPALRLSPGRELRAENRKNHKRGRSLEGGLILKEKDDDLALFNELQTREKDNFLLYSTDDLDDSLSTKLRYFSDFKLGISIPVRGENSDLLNASGRKNDYDWLLTPPDSPLFPSLDDETPPLNLAQRGRSRSQPVSIPKSATTDKSYRTSRSGASPQRLSPSPRSGNSMSQLKRRPSSAPHSSPSPLLRPSTPSRSPSTPPNKPLKYALRSSTPTSQKMNAGLSGTVASPGRRGTSPVKSSHGISATTKLLVQQSNIPGFSMDTPPNLRTSLSDRPTSYVRGSSPASRNGRSLSSKFGRQSMSPTSSRSPSSSYSFDRDQYSSQSKGSVLSSGDDDTDSLQTSTLSTSDHSAAMKVGPFSNSIVLALSKKPSRTLSSSSAPKRSFDSALRQMDQKRPQNMFRPLLSSVPSTTFYNGKAGSAYHPLTSRNSSVTTSSNASSEQGGSAAHDTEGSDHGHDDRAIEKDNAPYSDTQDEIFVFDNVDEINEDVRHEIHDGKPTTVHHLLDKVEPNESENFSSHSATKEIVTAVSKSFYVEGDLSGFDSVRNMATCSKCGSKFHVIEPMGGNDDICPDCSEKAGCVSVASSETSAAVTQNTTIHPEMTVEENESCDELEPKICEPEMQENTNRSAGMLTQNEMNVELDQSYLLDSALARSFVGKEQHLVDWQMMDLPTVGSSQCDDDTVETKLKNAHPSLKVDVSEGSGISVLLKKSSSSKWNVVQGRPFTATNLPCGDPLYARDTMNSMRSSTGHVSASASSSVDLNSSKQIEVPIQRQLSSRRTDMENSMHNLNAKAQRSGSSVSGISNHACQALLRTKSTEEENFDCSVENVESKTSEETTLLTEEQSRVSKSTKIDDRDSSFIRTDVHEGNELDHTLSCRAVVASTLELSNHTANMQLEDASVLELPNNEDCIISLNAKHLSNNGSISDVKIPVTVPDISFIVEDVPKSGACRIDVIEAPSHGSSVIISGELENAHKGSPGSQSDCVSSPISKSMIDEQYTSVSTTLEKCASVSSPESSTSDRTHVFLEESIVTDQDPGGYNRSLELDEATDVSLFCRSIVHNLAHQAATIGMEKENFSCQKGSCPTVTILGKSNSDWKDPRGRNCSTPTPKSQKIRQRPVETKMKSPSSPKAETDKKPHESLRHVSGSPSKVDNTRPPKLESKCNCSVM